MCCLFKIALKFLLSGYLVFFYQVNARAADGGIEAVTRPSADVLLSFVNAGKIREIAVKEGDLVKKGQILLRQND